MNQAGNLRRMSMKRVLILSSYASLYMFILFYLMRRFRPIQVYEDYFGPVPLFAFLGIMFIYFLYGHKNYKRFFKGFKAGLVSFLIIAMLSFLYTLIASLPLSIIDDWAMLILPYTPIESTFGLLNSMIKINVSGLTWYIGDSFNGHSDIILEQVSGLVILLLMVSITTGLGAIYKRKSNEYNESRNL